MCDCEYRFFLSPPTPDYSNTRRRTALAKAHLGYVYLFIAVHEKCVFDKHSWVVRNEMRIVFHHSVVKRVVLCLLCGYRLASILRILLLLVVGPCFGNVVVRFLRGKERKQIDVKYQGKSSIFNMLTDMFLHKNLGIKLWWITTPRLSERIFSHHSTPEPNKFRSAGINEMKIHIEAARIWFRLASNRRSVSHLSRKP